MTNIRLLYYYTLIYVMDVGARNQFVRRVHVV